MKPDAGSWTSQQLWQAVRQNDTEGKEGRCGKARESGTCKAFWEWKGSEAKPGNCSVLLDSCPARLPEPPARRTHFCSCGLSNRCDIPGKPEDVISVAAMKGIRPRGTVAQRPT